MDWNNLFASRMARVRASEIRELLRILDRPEVISFAGGIPAPELFPREALQAAYSGALADHARSARALQYSVSEGLPALRQWVVGYMAAKGVPCGIDNVIITAGSQQALDFIGKAFLGSDDRVLVKMPTYLGALQALGVFGPSFAPLQSGEAAKLAYVVPDFANPTGETMSREERIALLDLARNVGAAVIEDAAYTDLRYEGAAVPSVLALDIAASGSIEAARTIYCGTFSKTYAPGLRLGWMCAARSVVERMVLLKQGADLNCSTINQEVLTEVLAQGHSERMARLCAVYDRRRVAMLEALDAELPDEAVWSRPEGGMFIWVRLPDGLDGKALLQEAVAAGVAFVPGGAFFPDGRTSSTIRLSFSLPDENAIREGVSRLGALVRAKAGERAVRRTSGATP